MPNFAYLLDETKATNLFPRPQNPVPLEGTLPKCQHGVYDPDGEGCAWHCGFCREQSYAAPTKGFTLPRSSGTALTEHDRLHANAHGNSGACPDCGSRIHSIEPDGRWRCEECQHIYRAPRSKREHELVEAA